MATTYYLRDGGGTWASSSTWSTVGHASSTNTGTYPQAGDTATFQNGTTSGTVTLAADNACAVVTSAAGSSCTIAMGSHNLTTTGNVTLTGMTAVTATTGVWLMHTATFIPSGISIPNLTFNSTGTMTISGGAAVVGTLLSVTDGFTTTLATNGITCNGGISLGTGIVTAQTITLAGTGTIQCTSTGYVGSNLTINTSGTITIGTNFNYRTGTFTYTAGTVVTTSSTFSVVAACTINAASINWNIFATANTGNVTCTLSANITTVDMVCNSNFTCVFAGGKTINISHNLTFNGSGALYYTSTRTLFYMTGTTSGATWSAPGGGQLDNDITFDSGANTITISGTVYYVWAAQGIMTYASGTIVTTGSTLSIGSNAPSLDTAAGIVWNNFELSGNGNATGLNLLSALYISGTLSCGATAGATLIKFYDVYCSGSVSVQGSSGFTSTQTLHLTGTGNLTTPGGGAIQMPIIMASSGTVTLTGPVDIAANFTYSSGTLVGDGTETLIFNASGGLTLAASLPSSLTLANFSIFGSLGGSMTLDASKTITVTDGFLAVNTQPGSSMTLQSSSPGTRTAIQMTGTNPARASYITAIDIDSSGGEAVYNENGTDSNTLNWQTTPVLPSGGGAWTGFV